MEKFLLHNLFIIFFIHFFSYCGFQNTLLANTAQDTIDISLWDQYKIIGYIITSLSKPIVQAHLIERRPLLVANRLLLYGAPGNGKTTLAREIARAANCEFFLIRASALITKYQGSGSENLNGELSKALQTLIDGGERPVVIFIDEVDAIAVMGHGETSRIEHHNAVQELWQFLDTIKDNPRIFVICATNRYEKLNGAFISRFPEKQRLKIEHPEEKMRSVLLLNFMEKYNFMIYKDSIDQLAYHSNGMSVRELENFMYEIRLECEFETILSPNQVIDKIKKYVRGYKDPSVISSSHSRRDMYDNIHLITGIFSIVNSIKLLAKEIGFL